MSDKSVTLAVRIDPELDALLGAVAHRKRRSKSALVRDALRRYVDEDAYLAECRRQSLLVSKRKDEAESLEFIERVFDWPEDDEP